MTDKPHDQFTADFTDDELVISTAPYQCTLKQKLNNSVTWQMKAIRYRRPNAGWQTPNDVSILESNQESCKLLLIGPDEVRINLSLWFKGRQIRLELDSDHEQVEWLSVEILAQGDEH